MTHLDELNPQQKIAAQTIDGPLLIIAGAGAGKTKTLTHRIIEIIKQGNSPQQILAVTFTNKAAREMRERAHALLRKEGIDFEGSPFISTFHSLGVYILREQHEHTTRTKYFTILDQKDSLSLVKQAMKELSYDPKINDPKAVRGRISHNKGKCITPTEYQDTAESFVAEMTAQVWSRYEDLLKQQNAYDFDDLLVQTVRLFEQNAQVRELYQERWKYIHIDEYQDTNEAQYRITKALAEKYKNICVVGDADQTIYTWRGANVGNILNFENDYPEAQTVLLEQNYRSTQNILLAANEVIKKNSKRKEKNLFTKNKEGEHVAVFEALNERREAEHVAKTIKGLLADGVQPEDVAILYRANYQSRILEEKMLSSSIPYHVLGVRFFDRAEVKDLVAYIRLALNPASVPDLTRVINTPKRGIGKVTLGKIVTGQRDSLNAGTAAKVHSFFKIITEIKNFAEKHTVSETVSFAIEKSGLKDALQASKDPDDYERIENLKELVTYATRYDHSENGIQEMLSDIALASDQDSLDQKTDSKDNRVRLMTVHASKGLEFAYVFIVGLEQDLFPHSFDGSKKSDDEEERRLFYVALTRAKERVFLSHAMVRTIYGEQRLQEPSEFLSDLPDEIVQYVQEEQPEQNQFSTWKNNNKNDGDTFEYLVID